MPKMKTRSGAKKRFKVTGTGKLLRRDTMKSHNLEHKSAKPEAEVRHGRSRWPKLTVRRVLRAAGEEVANAARQARSPRAGRSGARSSQRRRATGGSSTARTRTRRSRSSTRSSTPIAIARRRSGRFAGSGSCGSTPRPGSTTCRTTSSSPAARRPEIELDRKVLADLAVSDPASFAGIAEQAKAALNA